jgi:AmmeMemoRadiSam system protein A
MRQTQPLPLESSEDREALLGIARASIRHGLEHGSPLRVDPDRFSPRLREPGACFVTLRRSGRLRGCVGSLDATRSLVEDVAHNAFASAFRDSRFEPLTEEEERAGLDVHLSVLTPPEPLPCRSEAELLSKLQPGIDGLILQDGPHRATFLPSVWESLTEPKKFLTELKRKAGLSENHWSDGIRFQRYRAESVE